MLRHILPALLLGLTIGGTAAPTAALADTRDHLICMMEAGSKKALRKCRVFKRTIGLCQSATNAEAVDCLSDRRDEWSAVLESLSRENASAVITTLGDWKAERDTACRDRDQINASIRDNGALYTEIMSLRCELRNTIKATEKLAIEVGSL